MVDGTGRFFKTRTFLRNSPDVFNIHGASLVNPPAAIAGHLEWSSSRERPVSEEYTHLRSVLLNLALMTRKLLAAEDLFNTQHIIAQLRMSRSLSHNSSSRRDAPIVASIPHVLYFFSKDTRCPSTNITSIERTLARYKYVFVIERHPMIRSFAKVSSYRYSP